MQLMSVDLKIEPLPDLTRPMDPNNSSNQQNQQ
jgi:hypothetical protein